MQQSIASRSHAVAILLFFAGVAGTDQVQLLCPMSSSYTCHVTELQALLHEQVSAIKSAAKLRCPRPCTGPLPPRRHVLDICMHAAIYDEIEILLLEAFHQKGEDLPGESACRPCSQFHSRAVAAQDRKEACEHIELPEKYLTYLDTSFLGPEKFVSVGPVDYSYHRFGPLLKTSNAGPLLPQQLLADWHHGYANKGAITWRVVLVAFLSFLPASKTCCCRPAPSYGCWHGLYKEHLAA